MHAVIRNIASDDVEFDSYTPDDSACFSLTIRMLIGHDAVSGADEFELCVCTPEWLRQTVWEPRWGRHLLIVRAYDRSSIERCIHEYVAKCMGDTWHEIATKLARNFSWEFEDYRS